MNRQYKYWINYLLLFAWTTIVTNSAKVTTCLILLVGGASKEEEMDFEMDNELMVLHEKILEQLLKLLMLENDLMV